MERTQRLLRSLKKDARLIEVGPSFSPLAAKRDGWNTFTIDHASREDLTSKYSLHAGVDVSQIEEVDFVWQGGSLAGAVPVAQHGTFDAFIASHVIEHTTDLVAFLKAAETLIRPDGIVILAAPDKRKCFDFYRHPSTTADAIVAFHEKRDRHDARTHLDYAMRMSNKGGAPGWHIDDTRETVLACTLNDAHHQIDVAAQPNYVDAHNWIFVPASFHLMLVELAAMEYIDLRVEEIAEAEATEFFVWLRRGREVLRPDALQVLRKRLMDRVVVELAEQSRQIPGSPLSQRKLAEADPRMEAMRIVLEAARASTTWRGLNRKKFQALIRMASRSIPADGPAAVQHLVLLDGARLVLGLPNAADGVADLNSSPAVSSPNVDSGPRG